MDHSERTRFPHVQSSSWQPEWSGKRAQEKCRPRCLCVSHCPSCVPSVPEFREPVGSKSAGRARAAAIAPFVALCTIAHVTAMAVLDDGIKKRFTADLLRHRKCVGLIYPHQRSVDRHPPVETE